MSTLSRQPPRVPMVDPKTGLITREWDRFFNDAFTRLGGFEAPTNTDLDVAMPEDSGVADLEMTVRTNDYNQSQNPPQVDMYFAPDSDQLPPATVLPLDDFNQTPPQVQLLLDAVEYLQTETRAQAEQIALLMTQIQEIKQGTML
jgi:hypothetical protein